MRFRWLRWLGAPLLLFFTPARSQGYLHTVQAGESLAELAELAYGDSRKESVIAFANALELHGGSLIAPGMRLEIPAPTYVRAKPGDTWFDLAKTYLGDAKRAGVLAKANGAVPWVRPEEGREILIFAVVSHIAGEDETVTTVARKYLLDPERAWHLGVYNQRKRPDLRPGEVLLVPLIDLALSSRGKREAEAYHRLALAEEKSRDFVAQQRAEGELARLDASLERALYTQAVAIGNQLLGTGELTRAQEAQTSRGLLEAYVALGELALAAEACRRFNAVAMDDPPELSFDPVWMSPKVLEACRENQAPR